MDRRHGRPLGDQSRRSRGAGCADRRCLARAGRLSSGERVLDIGCGGGSTTIAIARAVTPDGVALGIDISPDLTALAGRRAAEAGLGNARFLCSDAATVRLPEAPFDRLFSRFGSMFFDDPVAAFSNLHSLLRPGGRIDLAVWGPPRDNPWMMEMMTIARRHVEIPPAIPRAPGPFAFEDVDYLSEILTAAGFSAIEISAHTGPLPIGGAGSTPKAAVDFAFAALAFGRALEEQPEQVRSAAAREMTALFEKHHACHGCRDERQGVARLRRGRGVTRRSIEPDLDRSG